MTEQGKIVNDVSLIAAPLLYELGLGLVDVEFLHESGTWILRVFIDKEGGVGVDDCARVSRELGDLIESKDIISYHYVMEVSSPGLNRPLKKESDYIRSIGKMIRIKMCKPFLNRKNFTGSLANVSEGKFTLLLDDGNSIELPLDLVDKAKLIYERNN